MDARQRAYLDLLTHGLAAVVRLAHARRADSCQVEADHLHNLPSLVEEANEHRHRYYIVQERGLYLQRLRRLGAAEHLESMAVWYGKAWRALAAAAGVELSG